MIVNKSLIINLIGCKKNVSIASDEIRSFIFEKRFGVKVFENKNILNELNNARKLNRDVYINNCEILTCDEIKRLHYFINYNYSNLYSYGLLINKNDFNKITIPLINCPYINNIYNIDNNISKKNSIINEILYSNYKKSIKY